MKILFLFLISALSFNATANEKYSPNMIIGKWLCIEDSPNYSASSNIVYGKSTFSSITHTVIMENSTGSIIETKSYSSGSWRLMNDIVHHQVEKTSIDALNHDATRFIDVFRQDANNTKFFDFPIYHFQDDILSYWRDRDGLVYCIRK
jgi:hypothetical protein